MPFKSGGDLVADALEVICEFGNDDISVSSLDWRVVLNPSVTLTRHHERNWTHLGNEDSLYGRNDENTPFSFTSNHLVRVCSDGHELECVECDSIGYNSVQLCPC